MHRVFRPFGPNGVRKEWADLGVWFTLDHDDKNRPGTEILVCACPTFSPVSRPYKSNPLGRVAVMMASQDEGVSPGERGFYTYGMTAEVTAPRCGTSAESEFE
jgi:hypothetical protein